MGASRGAWDPTPPRSSLYEQLLGDAWGELRPILRRVHGVDAPPVVTGRARVAHGRTLCARLLVRALSLPGESGEASLELAVDRRAGRETWQRTIGKRRLVTHQRPGPEGLLVETYGMLELRFRLTVADGGIRFDQVGCGLRLGRLFLPLPSWLSPRVEACERAHESRADAWFRVDVKIAAPIAGRLFAYAGELGIDQVPRWR